MELFEGTRYKIGNLILSRKASRLKRRVHYSSVNEIRKIGIVWDASKSEDFPNLSQFHQRMHERNIDVTILGFYGGEELPDRLTAIRYLSCIRRRELNLFYSPVSEEAESFINTRFDVLIDINFEKKFPLYYITKLSTASLKVGLFDSGNGNSVFDLMMDLQEPVKIDSYLDHVVHYLELINAGVSEKVDKQ